MIVGFAIISHNEPLQLLRLVKVLSVMFCNPPIACHHNFELSPIDPSLFPSNVHFVIPHEKTKWGHISVVKAALRAFRLLKSLGPPDWYILLSGTDYPVRPASEILDDLSNSNYDVFLDARKIDYNTIPSGQTAQYGYGRPEFVSLAYDRYCAIRVVKLPWLSISKLKAGNVPLRGISLYIRNPRITARFSPTSGPIYAGALWIEANHKVIEYVIDNPRLNEFVRYYKRRRIPEESFFLSLICPNEKFSICFENKRYENWSAGGSHPLWIDKSHIKEIVDSRAHFARKFRVDGLEQDFFDEFIIKARN